MPGPLFWTLRSTGACSLGMVHIQANLLDSWSHWLHKMTLKGMVDVSALTYLSGEHKILLANSDSSAFAPTEGQIWFCLQAKLPTLSEKSAIVAGSLPTKVSSPTVSCNHLYCSSLFVAVRACS